MKKLILLALILATSAGFAMNPQKDEAIVNLPAENLSTSELMGADPANPVAWSKFIETHGQWQAAFGRHTGTPHRAIGKPITIEGYEQINESNIEAAAMKFLTDNESALGIDPAQLRLVRAREVRGRWYVSYVQTYKGLDVLLSEIELRIFNNGNVMAFGVDYYSDINISAVPQIGPGAAMEAAHGGMAYNPKRDRTLSNGEMYVLPYADGGKISYKLVYKAIVETNEPIGKYITYVDANNGAVVWRRNQVMKLDTKFSSGGGIKEKSPMDTISNGIFRDLYIKVGSRDYTTDTNGQADVNNEGPITAKLQGPYVRVTPEDRDAAFYSSTFTPGDDKHIEWNDENSELCERILFYHTNYIHDYYKNLDTDFDAMDFQMWVRIQYDGQITNAMSAGDMLYFIGAGNPELRFAESPSVLYHEYGHSINHFLYEQEGSEGGMGNSSCNEALADITSAFILDDPIIGRGTFADDPNEYIRNVDNLNRFPDDIINESHHDGLILGGAFWDLKEATDLETAQHLAHFARYGTPDDINTGIAFTEWFIEVLVTDDDDGNLTNGTTHAAEIIESFNKHNIGTALFMLASFDHDEFADTEVTDHPYILNFGLSAFPIDDAQPENVRLVYYINDSNEKNEAATTKTGPGEYSAVIPAQDAGTIVRYYFVANDPVSGELMKFSRKFSGFDPFIFAVGYENIVDQDFEQIDGWQIYDDEDDATQGRWEIAAPVGIEYGPYLFQPASNYSPDGTKCAVTGSGGSMQTFSMYMPNGTTTLKSPIYDFSNENNLAVEFQAWFFNMNRVPEDSFSGSLKLEISSDSGATWRYLWSIKESTGDWSKIIVQLDNDQLSDKMQFRFVARVVRYSGMQMSYTEALVDEFYVMKPMMINSVESGANADLAVRVYPNPATEYVNFEYSGSSDVRLSIFDSMGNPVASPQSIGGSGDMIFRWNGCDATGRRLPAGAYFYRLAGSSESHKGKLILE